MSNINQITVEYGSGFEVTVNVPPGSTIEDAIKASRAALGFGANVEGLVDGVPQPPTAPVVPGDRISVHDKACSKAAKKAAAKPKMAPPFVKGGKKAAAKKAK